VAVGVSKYRGLYLSGNQLRIVCTGRDSHTSRELALLEQDKGRSGGFAVAQGERGRHVGPVGSSAVRMIPIQGQVQVHRRVDGGATFQFPVCPTCGGLPRKIRDDKLAAFMKATPTNVLDVSLIP